ncbi:MAG: 3-dehydroquinate synthase, partial [Oscillospiraceae bacterium]
VGSFYNPSAVVIETDFLKTLPEDIFLDGIAEVIKYSLIYDKEIYNLLCNQDIDMPQVILKCVQAKKYFVMSDYKDHGLRNALNFGHTIAHAIEKDSNFAVSHGKAVAMGMAMAEKYIAKDTLIYKKICSMLERFCLPVEYYNKENLIKYICQDKKIEFDKVRFVLLEDIGKYKFEFISIEQIKNMLSYNGE